MDIVLNFYRPQRSWGKVIFSEACVKNSVHRGGVHGRGPFLAGGGYAWYALQGGMLGRGRAWRGTCMTYGQ